VSTAPRLVLGCALLLAAAALLAVAVLGARGRLPRNPWIGVRTRRTLASDEAFELANRVAAAPLGAAGAVALVGGAAAIVGVLTGGPAVVTWTVLVVATAGMLGLTGVGGALGDRAATRMPAPGSACAGTCAGCDLVAGCRSATTTTTSEHAAAPPDRP
jgi:SdpI/YfhL protein family